MKVAEKLNGRIEELTVDLDDLIHVLGEVQNPSESWLEVVHRDRFACRPLLVGYSIIWVVLVAERTCVT